MGKDNNIISKYDEMQINLSPTLKDIEDLCGFKLINCPIPVGLCPVGFYPVGFYHIWYLWEKSATEKYFIMWYSYRDFCLTHFMLSSFLKIKNFLKTRYILEKPVKVIILWI